MGMLLYIVNWAVEAYTLIIFVYVLMSWIPTRRGLIGDIDNVLSKICEPYLGLFRKLIPPIGGMVDVSPIIAIVALQALVWVLNVIFGAIF